ncbi:MAG TPA: hypothetical protein VM940_00305 [Chthoniobacterales bacterium]|jgi:hypothetical protein|nr:hypothetical protein [Chthoniobacterales bacterium]
MKNLPNGKSAYPPLPASRRGRITRTEKIDGSPLIYRVEDQAIFEAPSNPAKAFLIQKLALDEGQGFENGPVMFRIGYYMIAHRPRVKGKWAWGQFAPMMTAEELQLIVRKMKAMGWMDSGDNGTASNAEAGG